MDVGKTQILFTSFRVWRFQVLHPGYGALFKFDNSQNHHALAPDGWVKCHSSPFEWQWTRRQTTAPWLVLELQPCWTHTQRMVNGKGTFGTEASIAGAAPMGIFYYFRQCGNYWSSNLTSPANRMAQKKSLKNLKTSELISIGNSIANLIL